MRLPALALLLAVSSHVDDGRSDKRVRLAGLAESVPELFIKIANDKLKGRIDTRSIRYDAPSSVVLEGARLLDPKGNVVARVQSARATLSLRALLSGDIVVSRVELEAPTLDLVMVDKKLNLIEALTPKKPPEKKQDPKAAFRIDDIIATRASFTFTDGENVTITAAGISATASLDIDLSRDIVIVDVKQPRVNSGKVALKELDVPLTNVKARQVVVYKERVDIYDAAATASGANVTASGSVTVRAPGNLAINGFVDAPANAWPDRLARLPFATPALKGKVSVTGRFEDPLVSADATFGKATAYGYTVDGGRGVVTVKKALVRIYEGSQVKTGGGAAHVEGTVTLPERALDLRVRAVDVPLAAALAPAKLEPAPRGTGTARAHVTGIADGKSPLKIQASGTARRAELAGVKAPGDVQLDARVTVHPKVVSLDAATLQGEGFDARVSGSVLTEAERVALTVDARVTNAPRWVPAIPAELALDAATFAGSVAGPYKAVVVEGDATASRGAAWGVPIDEVRAHVAASAERVTLSRVRGTAAGGVVEATRDVVVELKGKKALRGTVVARKVDLGRVKAPDGSALPLAGIADAEAVLAGPYDDPTVTVRAAVGGLVVAEEPLGSAVARFQTTKRRLDVSELRVDGPVLAAESTRLALDLEELTLDGVASLERIDLALVENAKEAKLAGTGYGVVRISGAARAPTVRAELRMKGVAVGPQRFGDGIVDAGIAPDGEPAAAGAPPRHVATLAAKLASDLGAWDATAALAIQRQVVNARVRFDDVDLEPFTSQIGDAVAPLQGFASGDLEAWGPLAKPSVRLRARVPELAVAPVVAVARDAAAGEQRLGAPQVPLLRPLGALVVEGRMDDGELAARVCAFPAAQGAKAARDDASPCTQGERVWANVTGALDPLHGVFDLSVDGMLEERALEDIVPAIARRGFRVGAKARASAQLAREEGEEVAVTAQATLLAASIQPPDEELRATLQAPADVLYDARRMLLETPARFATPNGEIDVTVGGAAGDEDIALDVEGSVALALAKLFTEQIANARGTAQTELSIRGRYDEGVAIEGSITPAPGAVVTPRALGQPITFLGGTVQFAPAGAGGDDDDTDKDSAPAGLLRITADTVHARIGDGDATLRGFVDARTVREADEGWVHRWDLALTGSGLSVRFPNGRAEGGADLELTGTEAAPLLRGRVEVTDGTFRKVFELRNFVLASAPGKPSEPLWQTLAPIGLANLELDVALTMQNFRTRAHVASFNADMMLRGNLRVSKLLRLPSIAGAVEAEEGEITFPRARFEVIEMQVEFPSTGDGRLNPLVHLTARAEIPPGGAGSNDTEIPIDLYLDGDLEEGITLDLTAVDPQRQWSRNDLLGLILFGQTVEETVAERDLSVALNALLNEASAPITDELEAFAQSALGVDVEIGATGWRWQLGRRLQVEGEVSLVDPNNGAGNTAATTGASGASTASATSTATTSDTLRLRLLILDHLPFGRELSLEGRNSALGTDLRLSLRIFEE